MQLLGAEIEFQSNDRRLLDLALTAYIDLPPHRFYSDVPTLKVNLLLRPSAMTQSCRRFEPPPLDMFSGAEWLGAATQSADFVVLSPTQRTALVVVSPQTLTCAYHTRYELIEFAVFTLAARCLHLASLHAACVGLNGRAVVLMGASGSGKSTVTMKCLLSGFDFLSEDSVFVAPETMQATGIANFLHVRADSLRWLESKQRAQIRKSPVIRRRSGVRKFEVDLRQGDHRLASKPLKIAAVVFLSARQAVSGRLLQPLSKAAFLSRLTRTQAYAVNQPEWPLFSRNITKLKAYELRRGAHPDEAVEVLRSLLTIG
jgi:energy-coupling factor transporter ATP-binding protein EcfA2